MLYVWGKINFRPLFYKKISNIRPEAWTPVPPKNGGQFREGQVGP